MARELFKVEAQGRELGLGGQTVAQPGLRIRLPMLALAAAESIVYTIAQPNGTSILSGAGFNEHTIHWLSALTQSQIATHCAMLEVVLPAAVFNAQAANFSPKDGEHINPAMVEDYLMKEGATASMMWELCGISAYEFRQRLKAMGLAPRKGRPPSLKHGRTQVLDAWAALQREEALTINTATKQGEPYVPRSKAQLYLELHYRHFQNESFAALYNVLADVAPLSANKPQKGVQT